MLKNRAWRLDLAAGILLCTGMLVALAVFSFDPADLPGSVYPADEEPRNILGAPGASIAGELVQTLGVAVYVWLAAWFVFVLLLLLRRRWLAWTLRSSVGYCWSPRRPSSPSALYRPSQGLPSWVSEALSEPGSITGSTNRCPSCSRSPRSPSRRDLGSCSRLILSSVA